MAKLIDKFWNWGHLEGSHNQWLGMDLHMTPEEFGEIYGIRNSFMVSSKGNIQPPFDALADRTASLKKVCWSILGDSSTPLPEHPLGETEEILRSSESIEKSTLEKSLINAKNVVNLSSKRGG